MRKKIELFLAVTASAVICAATSVSAADGSTSASAADGSTNEVVSQKLENTETTNQGGKAAPQDEVLEAIVVTGSRVEVSAKSSSTVVSTYSAEDLSRGAPTSVTDALNLLPIFTNSTGPLQNVGQGYGTSGASAGNLLNLRGLGPNRTLIMIDGVRVPPTQPDGSVNVDIIPQALLKRVDVVTGGASAAYGSDAVVGVVNYILDTNFTGVQATLQGGLSSRDDAGSYRVGIAAGTPFADNRGHFEMSLEQYNNTGIGSFFDRPDAFVSQGGIGTPAQPFYNVPNGRLSIHTFGGTPVSGSPVLGAFSTTFLPNGTLAPFNHGGSTGAFILNNGGDGDYFTDISLLPDQQQNNAFARLSFDLTDNLTVFTQALYASSAASFIGDGNFSYPGSNFVVSVFPGNAFLNPAVAPAVTAPFNLSRNYGEMPQATRLSLNTAKNFTVGILGSFGNSWKWDASVVYGENTVWNEGKEVYLPNEFAAMDAVTNSAGKIVCRVTLTNPGLYPGCAPLNLFGVGNPSLAAINYIMGDSVVNIVNKMTIGNANLRGTLFDDWAGPVQAAIGGEIRKQSLDQTSNTADVPDFTGLRGVAPGALSFELSNFGDTSGSVNVKEFYTEAQVPLLKDLPFAKSLDMNVAGRYTNYSTSGGVETWKLGLAYQPFNDLVLRGAVSRDIRAPDLNALYQGSQTTTIALLDPFTNTSQASLSVTHGNPNLQPEKALTRTFGVAYTPSWLPGFTVTADYFDIKIKDAIEVNTPAEEIDACYASGPSYNSPDCALVNRPFPLSNRTIANYPSSIVVIPENQAEVDESGIDFTPHYLGQFSAMNSSWRGSYEIGGSMQLLLSGQTQLAAGLPFYSTAGYGPTVGGSGLGPRVKGSIFIGYNNGPLSVRITNRFTGRSNRAIPGAAPDTQVYADYPYWPNKTYTDLDVRYQIREGVEAFVNVKNAFDVLGPYYGTSTFPAYASNGNPEMYDDVGRYFTAGVRVRFGADGDGAAGWIAGEVPVVAKSGLYASLGAGANVASSQTFHLKQPVISGGYATAPTTDANVSFTTGGAVIPAIGYKWGNGLRTELEFSSREAGISSFNNGPNPSGHQDTYGVMANVVYDLDISDRFTPYVGAGLGVSEVRWRYVTGDYDPLFSSASFPLQWQVIGGVSHPIFNNTEVYAEYRYVRDSETSFHTAPWSPSTGVGSLASHYAAAANDFIVGLRHTF